MILYVTYTQNGVKKKGAMKESQYDVLSKDPSVGSLTIHPNSRLMEQAFKGGASGKRVLLG